MVSRTQTQIWRVPRARRSSQVASYQTWALRVVPKYLARKPKKLFTYIYSMRD